MKQKQTAGQAIIELAIMIPLMLMLIMGVLDLGRVFFVRITVTNAAREGAYYLSYHPEDKSAAYAKTILAVQNEAVGAGVKVNAADVVVSNCCTAGQPVSVTVKQTVTLSILNFLFGPINVDSTIKMLVQ